MEKHHGRLEQRRIWALSVRPDEVGFSATAQVLRIERHFVHLRSGHSSQESVLALCSRPASSDPAANAQRLLEASRAHWQIENGIHYSRDRSYDEDRCQVRDPNSAQILATLRSLARFLARGGAHRPKSAHQRTTPGLNRFCSANRDTAIGWLLSRRAPF